MDEAQFRQRIGWSKRLCTLTAVVVGLMFLAVEVRVSMLGMTADKVSRQIIEDLKQEIEK